MHKNDFLSQLIGNSARARVLRALVLNENEVFTPTRLAKRAGISARAATRELSALSKIGVTRKGKAVVTKDAKRTKVKSETVWFLDPHFRYLRALSTFVREISPMRYEQVLSSLRKIGKLSAVVLSGSFTGDPTRPADILVAGEALNERRLDSAVKILESVFGRELRYAAFSTPEFRYRLTIQDRLLRDTLDYPHLVLLDRSGLL